MKKLLGLFLLTLIPVLASFSQTREVKDFEDFSGVSFGVAGKLILEQGNAYRVVLEGDQDVLEDIDVLQRNGRLIIRNERWLNWGNNKITAYITMPEVEDLAVSGSGKIIAEDNIRSEDLEMNVSGSGDILLNMLSASSIDCSISGSGTINLDDGSANEGDMSISGSGKFNAGGFTLQEVDISISGSGNCSVRVEDQLDARISGSGDVYYSGNPSVDARVSGSGKVRKK